jgi:hypothetical protein
MPAGRPPSTISTTNPEPPSSPSALVLAAGWIGAVILMLVFAIQAYWAASDAGPHFRPLLPPLVVGALTITTTLGAAVLLLTRVAVLAIHLPRWLLRAGPWLLTAFFASVAAGHLRAVAANPTGDWQIDLQGPLLLLLAGLCIIVASEEPSQQTSR